MDLFWLSENMKSYISYKRVCTALQLEFLLESNYEKSKSKRFHGADILSLGSLKKINAQIEKEFGRESMIDRSRILSGNWESYYHELRETNPEVFRILNDCLKEKVDLAVENVKPKLKSYIDDNPGIAQDPEEFFNQAIESIENRFAKY